MTRFCLWCLEEWEAPNDERDAVAATTCQDCRAELFQPGEPVVLSEYLNQLEAPILVLDGETRVVTFNDRARALLGKNPPECAGQFGGDVMECAYARLPGGCGHTIHCQACTIRRTVTGTLLSGEPQRDVLAYQDIVTPAGPRQVLYKVSTEKVGHFVLLRINAASGQ
jgi:PAS domain-containing protein